MIVARMSRDKGQFDGVGAMRSGDTIIVAVCYCYYSAPVVVRSIAISLSVCLSVCLSIREHISGTADPNFRILFSMSPVALALSSSGGVTIRYVLPVL